MKVFQIPVGPMQNFSYLVKDDTSEAMAIDSGWEVEPIVRVANEQKMKVKFVCATHGHYDHVRTIGTLADELGATTVAFRGAKVGQRRSVRDGETLAIGDSEVRVLHTPGHTEDSVCYFDGTNLFTGDTLFIEAWGRTDMEGGSDSKLFASLHETILRLPPTTVVYPGHDYGSVPSRSLGEEAKKNPALFVRSLGEFERLMQG